MALEGWHERHGTCRFGTYRASATEGEVVAACSNPQVGNRYTEKFCARECPAHDARPGRMPHGRIPPVEEIARRNTHAASAKP